MELKDDITTNDVLKFFWKHDVGIAQVESCPVVSCDTGNDDDDDDGTHDGTKFEFFAEFHGEVGDANVDSLLVELKSASAAALRVLDENEKERLL